MASNPYVNKVVFGSNTLIDISDTTATADKILQGYGAYGADGAWMNGTATAGSGSAVSVVDTLDTNGGTIRTITAVSLAGDTVAADKLLSGYTAHNALGEAITGTYIPSGSTFAPHLAVITKSGNFGVVDITYNGTRYTTAGNSFVFNEGDTITIKQSHGDSNTITVDGVTVASAQGTATYDYTAPDHDILFTISGTAWTTGQTAVTTDSDIKIKKLDTLSATSNTTYTPTSGYSYSSVTVNVPASQANLQTKTNIDPTTSSQTIEADTGYDGLASVQINAMPSGSATAPATISGSSASVSTGTNTLTLSKTVSVTPSVSAGYVESGTAGNSAVSLTASVTTKAADTITPTSSNKTISSGTYLTGTQTIEGIVCANLTAANIKSGVTVKIGTASDGDSVTSVTGTYSGGGTGMNKQIYYGPANVKNNGYIASSATLTVATTGTYKVSWTAWRSSSSGTMGTNLYKNTTSGTNQQTFTGTYGQCITLTGQSYTAGDVLTIYATSGSSSRTIYIANFVIEQTA